MDVGFLFRSWLSAVIRAGLDPSQKVRSKYKIIAQEKGVLFDMVLERLVVDDEKK